MYYVLALAGNSVAQDTVGAHEQLALPSLSHFASNAQKHVEHNLAPRGAAVQLPPACFTNNALATVSVSELALCCITTARGRTTEVALANLDDCIGLAGVRSLCCAIAVLLRGLRSKMET